ncbi:MAG TPA: amidohydrolase family protein [Chloroflexota bacterium]|nr:amidohydrolase family protein [Chloroflexota bacterium]
MKIDVFPHVLPRVCIERFEAAAPPEARDMIRGLAARPALAPMHDMDARFRLMDQVPGGCQQVITMCVPPIEQVATGQTGAELARLANDTMAELVQRHPDRFRGFAAALPMDDPQAAVRELDRAIGELGAFGIQIFTNANGLPLDEPRFEPVFARMAELDKAIWVHGARQPGRPDYAGEEHSKFGLWLSLGWPYEMAMFAARVVCSGLLDRYPKLRIITHHGGGMIPTFGHRVSAAILEFEPEGHETEVASFAALKAPPGEYFKRFFADTSASALAIDAAIKFFGPEHVLWGTDMPFVPPAANAAAIEGLGLDDRVLNGVFEANALQLLGVGR